MRGMKDAGFEFKVFLKPFFHKPHKPHKFHKFF